MPTVISSKSPGFIKRRPRCLNLYAAKASQAQRKREAISDDCIPALVCVDVLPNECPASSPSLLVTDFYSVSATVQIIFKQRFFLKTFARFCPRMYYQYSSFMLFVQALIISLAAFADLPRLRFYKWT